MTQSLRTIALALTLAAVIAAGGGGAAGLHAYRVRAATAVRPNIVVLMVDDLDMVSFREASRAGLLPHLGRLFDRGTEFRESFVTESLCCPSRATYLTGLYPHNHGVVRNGGPRGGFDDFMRAHGDDNLAVWMQGAGYSPASPKPSSSTVGPRATSGRSSSTSPRSRPTAKTASTGFGLPRGTPSRRSCPCPSRPRSTRRT